MKSIGKILVRNLLILVLLHVVFDLFISSPYMQRNIRELTQEKEPDLEDMWAKTLENMPHKKQ